VLTASDEISMWLGTAGVSAKAATFVNWLRVTSPPAERAREGSAVHRARVGGARADERGAPLRVGEDEALHRTHFQRIGGPVAITRDGGEARASPVTQSSFWWAMIV
jgi:hypothetical protein